MFDTTVLTFESVVARLEFFSIIIRLAYFFRSLLPVGHGFIPVATRLTGTSMDPPLVTDVTKVLLPKPAALTSSLWKARGNITYQNGLNAHSSGLQHQV